MKNKRIFFPLSLAAMAAALVLSSFAEKAYAQTYYEDDTFYDTEYSEKEAIRKAEEEIMSLPADLPNSGIKLTTDSVSEASKFFAEALIEEQKRNIPAAMASLKKAIEAAPPDSLYIYQHAAELALDTGLYDDAEKWADYLIMKDSSSAQNWVLFGNSKWAKEKPAEAREAYLKAQKLDPNNYEALYQYAILISEQNPNQALSCLEKYKKIRPEDSAEIDYRIAVVYNIKGNMPKTEEYLLKSIKENPYHVPSLYSLIELYEIKKDTSSAVQMMERLAETEPGNIKLLKQIAEISMETDMEKAERYFRMIKKTDKTDPDACFWLAATAEDNKDYAEAAKQLEDSRSLWKQPDLLMRLGFYYTQTNRYKEGVELLEKAYEKFPENENIAYYLALGLDDLGRTEKAYEILDLLARKKPDNKEYRYLLAQICDKLNKTDEMEQHFKEFLKMSPDDPSALNHLGYSLAERGIKLEEAKKYISRALELVPDDGAYIDSMAWAEYKLGNMEQAMEMIIKAKNALPQDPVIWAHYGEINQAAGKLEEAWKGWKSAYILDTNNKEENSKKIKEIEKKLPAKKAPELHSWYYQAFLPLGKDFSAFGSIETQVKGKKIKADIIVRYDESSGSLKLTALSPLYSPIWSGQSDGNSAIMDLPDIEGIDKEAFRSWAALMLQELRDWHAGKYQQAIKKSWKGKKYTSSNGIKVKIDDDGFPKQAKSSRNKKMKLEFDDYFLNNMYFFPGTVKIKIPFFKLKLKITPEKLKLKSFNGFNGSNQP